jgi:hypothetical protein
MMLLHQMASAALHFHHEQLHLQLQHSLPQKI